MSMPVITLTPSSKTGLSSPPEISKNVREASFSSYLDGAEATFVLKLAGARTQGLISTPHDHILLGKKTTDDREIDVFAAEKYFNEGLNRSPKVCTKDLSSHHHEKDAPIGILAVKEHPPTAPLSIRSESSWNSRSALLHNVSRNQKPRKANKSFLATIGCNCSCADNYSTDIDDCVGETNSIKSTSTAKSRKGDKTNDHLVRKPHSDSKFGEPELRVNSQGHFTFPVFNSKIDEAAKRKSPEVFGSPVMEKKLPMITWDAIAPSVSEEIRIPSISSEMQNDSDSDSSSDLFEIESLSKGNPFLSRQASGGLSGCRTPTNCYAPSEGSIEWSVITASAADFSVLSDSEEFTVPCPKKVGINSKHGSFKEIPKLRPSILSGCKNHRAVSIAGDAHKPIELDISNARKSNTLMTRFHHESKVASFDAKSRQQSFDARILSQKRPELFLKKSWKRLPGNVKKTMEARGDMPEMRKDRAPLTVSSSTPSEGWLYKAQKSYIWNYEPLMPRTDMLVQELDMIDNDIMHHYSKDTLGTSKLSSKHATTNENCSNLEALIPECVCLNGMNNCAINSQQVLNPSS
ncbi:hypothetical protein ACS0TY_009905 [Phlomoides rotata]